MTLLALRALTLGAILSATTLLPAAEAAVMTFNDVSGDFTPFTQALGDIAGLDVSNVTRLGFGSSPEAASSILHWGVGYSELTNAAFAAANGQVGELTFTPDSGMEVVLTSFVFGNFAYGNVSRDVTFLVYDASWTQIWSQTIKGHTGNSQSVALNLVLDGPVHFQWGSDWNMGLGSFTYDVRRAGPDGTVPVPASLPLLAGALAGIAALRRKRA